MTFCIWAACFIAPVRGFALELTIDENNQLWMKGDIVGGDYARLVKMIHQNGRFPHPVWIASNGGDVGDAMRIGHLFRSAYATVIAVGQCHSACFLIWIGAPDREVIDVTFGLHRTYYDPSYFSGLPSDEAETKYRELENAVSAYMEEMGVPTILLDKMKSVPSSDAYPLSGSDMTSIVGKRSASFHEWLVAKCGELSDSEGRDMNAIHAMNMVDRAFETWEKTTDPEDKSAAAVVISTKAEQANYARSLSEGYRAYLATKNLEIGQCELAARRETQEKVFRDVSELVEQAR